jgi:hypothetical protein
MIRSRPEGAEDSTLASASTATLAPGVASSAGASTPGAPASPSSNLQKPRSPAPLANPLRLSGLALTGANLRDSAAPDQDDGILTAEEIAALDLRGVEWAVLSACDTGIGDVGASEGVFGLRRALRIAVARTVVSSLWSIKDDVALRWMEALYRERWVEGRDTATAARAASRIRSVDPSRSS